MRENPVQDKSYAFGLAVVGLYRDLCGRREYVLSKQLVRAGTSVGANVEEAMAAQSRRDTAIIISTEQNPGDYPSRQKSRP